MEVYKLYKHTSPSGKVYIGITCKNPKDRFRSGKGYVHNSYFYRAIKKYGWDNIEHKILLDGLTFQQAKKLEQWYIKYYNSNDLHYGYNLTLGGEGCLGYKHSEEHKKYISEKLKGRVLSEETKRKLSEANKGKFKGEKNPFYGKKHSIETKLRISEVNKGNESWLGRSHSEETKKKLSRIKTGIKYSQETKTKQSIASKKMWQDENFRRKMIEKRKGTNIGKENPMAKKCICLNTSEIFDCIKDASQIYGCYPGISKCCRGKAKSAGKHSITGEPLKWMYYEEYLKTQF